MFALLSRNCSSRIVFRIVLTIFVVIHPAFATYAAWHIHDPVADSDYSVSADIQGSGTGDANEGYTIEIKSGSMILGAKADSVSPDENWSTLMEPHPTLGWHQDCGTKNCVFRMKQHNGGSWQELATQDITITKTCGV
ncbi:MAG: hypothetical protein R3C59_05300 [Planctomycetaceae bacterium]